MDNGGRRARWQVVVPVLVGTQFAAKLMLRTRRAVVVPSTWSADCGSLRAVPRQQASGMVPFSSAGRRPPASPGRQSACCYRLGIQRIFRCGWLKCRTRQRRRAPDPMVFSGRSAWWRRNNHGPASSDGQNRRCQPAGDRQPSTEEGRQTPGTVPHPAWLKRNKERRLQRLAMIVTVLSSGSGRAPGTGVMPSRDRLVRRAPLRWAGPYR